MAVSAGNTDFPRRSVSLCVAMERDRANARGALAAEDGGRWAAVADREVGAVAAAGGHRAPDRSLVRRPSRLIRRGSPVAAHQGLAKSCVQKGTPRPLYATATPTLRNRQLRMFARWPGLLIHAFMTAPASGWPQAMFSP